MTARRLSAADRFICHLDRSLRTVFGNPPTTGRPYPANGHDEGELDTRERRHAAGLMRVNHCGEVCAQALYEGQAITARDASIRDAMRHASDEENDHLDWCNRRLTELDSHTSRLNPLFYLGSLAFGAAAGAAGDRWSLGFLAETENQVVRHLEGHLGRLPEQDVRSRAIVTQMRSDEAGHAAMAVDHGAAALPRPIQGLMGLSSALMTRTTYWL